MTAEQIKDVESWIVGACDLVNQEGWRDPKWVGGFETGLWDLMDHLWSKHGLATNES